MLSIDGATVTSTISTDEEEEEESPEENDEGMGDSVAFDEFTIDSIAIDDSVELFDSVAVAFRATIDDGVDETAVTMIDGALDRDLNRLGIRGLTVVRGAGVGVEGASGSR
jgi:hypothetical protein